ncbi:DUF4395 family protein [Candidatus Peregrinibacteria bacterium]|nr:DUF4395 family protein [Candidatus Peregrinibacteria bacterium]
MKNEYGKIIPGLQINGKPAPYPVVNERSIRATAGIMFAIGFFTFATILYTRDYTLMYIIVPLFWLDFFLKAVFDPKYSIFGFFGRLFVRGQKPEYVGAIQKRFAWSLGLAMATTMMIIAIGFGIRGVAPFAICMTCLLFMWMESALGICVGCKIYSFLLKKGVMKMPEFKPACPGGACSIN